MTSRIEILVGGNGNKIRELGIHDEDYCCGCEYRIYMSNTHEIVSFLEENHFNRLRSTNFY